MVAYIEHLLARYEEGALSRRQLVAGLAAVAAQPASAQSPLPAVSLNHVTLSVSDVERSRQFYEKLFGMKIATRQSNGINLGAGPASFVGLYKLDGPPAINHFCLGARAFQAEQAAKLLERQGVPSRIRDRDGVKEMYIKDPDGITVQVQDQDYRG